jgi:hypothetical protein
VQFVESAASACVWLKLNAFPAASSAFAPARPARPKRLMGGMSATVAATGAAEPDADGHGAGEAEAAAAGALPLAAGAGALPLAAGAAALAAAAGALAAAAGALALAAGALALAAGAAGLPLAAGAAPLALAAAEAQLPRADCSIVVALPPPETAMMIPRVRPNAIGMARGTAMRAARLLPRRRGADRCPLSIQSTSMWNSPGDAPGASR